MPSFRDRVRSVVAGIPRGETLTYGAVALAAGNPRAARAVASIMARNVDPAVPCHRVVRADGTLGGYNRGGEGVKRALLAEERRSRLPGGQHLPTLIY
ncbi:methylated-DNA--[protein]-cysteine S-methyltransferase [Patescibacteria group bacterium]|jgi:O-6-methylguanine DNA methyltransferase|nr:methylated-DNA--[protein]-cysteine S-methyltransferase [Patescibacteria group bacterium]